MTVVIKNAEQLRQAKEDLELLRKAWRKILAGGQEYEMAPLRMRRANLEEVSGQISAYEQAITAYEHHGTSGPLAKRVIPAD